MHVERSSQRESAIIGEALRAAADGPFFPDWEFQTLFGLTRVDVRQIADEWPLPHRSPDEVVRAINNSLNWLLTYPHHKHEVWLDWFSADQHMVSDLYYRLRGKRDETFFDRFM